ncbi:MAG: alpha-ketoacid dehydrogenase subunit beta [Deltaproteobacteria bacterium]|nr:alpha-ketoacid dehydrogenase subunit beta [Deltaproteobacteria bacterium]
MIVTHLESIRSALERAMDRDSRVVLLGQDIADPYGGAFKVTRGLSTDFPGRVINTPISEASITGLASGMALQGLHPILEIMFGDFLTLCADQVINHASKFCSMYRDIDTLPMVMRVATGGYRGYGPTHSQNTEKLFFGFPGVTIIAPSCFHDSGLLLEKAIESQEFTLFMEHKLLYAQEVINTDRGSHYHGFQLSRKDSTIDETVVLTPCEQGEAPMITIVTYGGISSKVFSAARAVLLEEDITCEIVVPALIKPLQMDDIVESARRSGRVLIVEETHRSWGWGAEVAAQAGQNCFQSLRCPVARLAAKDVLIPSARPLENEVLPQVEDVVQELLKLARA